MEIERGGFFIGHESGEGGAVVNDSTDLTGVEEVDISLEKTDIRVAQLRLLWVPTNR